jgi:hypothetical protein
VQRRNKKRKAQEDEYSYRRRVWFSDPLNRICEVGGCWRDASQIHHKKGRIGELLLDERYWMSVCHKCHDYIEKHPEWAKEKGYSLNRYQNEKNED